MRLSFDTVAGLLASQPSHENPADERTRAAVAMILRQCGGTEMLFIQRAAHYLDPWSGHLAFPGGKVEPGEEPRAAAERETGEEVGIDLGAARYLGRLREIIGANLPVRVSCFVYGVNGCGVAMSSSDEVADAFWVGMPDLSDPERHIIAPARFHDRVFNVPAIRLPGPGLPVLWGITYRLVMQFLAALPEEVRPGLHFPADDLHYGNSI